MTNKFKIVRTDLELETPHVDATLRAAGHTLTLLPDGITEDALIAQVRDAELLPPPASSPLPTA
jgi:D-3-phosphoglycerate dehydrogenase